MWKILEKIINETELTQSMWPVLMLTKTYTPLCLIMLNIIWLDENRC